MMLAEANQWPSDVRPYFGEGDECHMAFHFPLMPRMFMALRQEDRHAITEILNQTPELPPTSQWALFLRNHDELTVEMITDEERDYMYSVYANDPQMRINGGIRRRLAPLVENSRRRVELLTGLLFSLPGTPVVYYGDEIGMGDNIYLGDRNGVRTPMQWSGDRNAGFSRADPARLFAPPIQDPVYGYQSINVEAQERYPFSLLNWMKRLIALRRQHPVFGRGSLDFVGCANRKILAYVRRDERETILVVVNLSRDVQPAALELGAFAGLMPVEMHGLTEFPRIGSEPVLPDAERLRVLLVHPAAGLDGGDAARRGAGRQRRGHRRGAADAADGRRLDQHARRRHARRPRAPGAGAVPAPPALDGAGGARDPPGALRRLGAAAPRRSAGVPDHRPRRVRGRRPARAACCRWPLRMATPQRLR